MLHWQSFEALLTALTATLPWHVHAQACADAGVSVGEPLSENPALLKAALAVAPGAVRQHDFLPVYSSFLRDLIKKGVNSKDSYHFPLAGEYSEEGSGWKAV